MIRFIGKLAARFGRAIARAGLMAAVTLCTLASAQSTVNYSDMWWYPLESGWGLSLSHHNDQMFGVLYVYDTDGSPMWVTIPGGTFSNEMKLFVGDVYRTTGPSASSFPFDTTRVQHTKVGTATIQFTDANSALLQYSINGNSVQKLITRQSFGDWPSSYPFDATDIWWNPQESGWGLSITRQGGKAFSVAFIHDTNGRPVWVVGPSAIPQTQGFSTVRRYYNWDVYLTRGSPYNLPWRGAELSLTKAGTLIFEHGINSAIIEATLVFRLPSGASVARTVRPMERMSFGTPRVYPNKAIDTTPGHGSQGIPVNSKITVEMGRPLRLPVTGTGATATTKGFFLYDGPSPVIGRTNYVAGSIYTADDVYRTLEFYPSTDLKPETTYRAVIRGQTSTDGSPVEDVEWQFRTGAIPNYRDSPFILFSFRNHFAVEDALGSSPIIRALSEPAYSAFVVSRMISSDGPIHAGDNIWIASQAGIQEVSTSKTYRFAVLDREQMRYRQLVGQFTRTSTSAFRTYACTRDGVRCLIGSTQTDSSGKAIGSTIDVFSTSTGFVERTISIRDSRDGFLWLDAMVAGTDAIYAVFRSSSSETEIELAALSLATGQESGRLRVAAYAARGMAYEPSRGRLWLGTYSRTSPFYAINVIDTATLRSISRVPTGAFGSPGYGVSVIPGTQKLLALDVAHSNIQLLDGDGLALTATLPVPAGNAATITVNSMCVESNGARAWALLEPRGVVEILIEGNSLRLGRRLEVDPQYTGGSSVGDPIEQIKCLH